jgi:hypothetical protein
VTDTLPHVVVPYADFLDRRERRRRIATELRPQDAQRPFDVEAVVVAGARPLSSEQKYRDEGPCRVKYPERATLASSISIDDLR